MLFGGKFLRKNRRRSFAARLSAAILIFTILIFVTAFSLFFHFSSQSVADSARQEAEDALRITSLRIENILRTVEAVPHNLRSIVSGGKIPPDSLYALTARVVADNEYIYGCATAFEPFYFNEEELFFSPFSYLEGDSIVSKQLGTDIYNYFGMEWYAACKERNAPHWSDPYYDEGGGQMLMCTYSSPIHDPAGRFIGVFTSDISLDWLAEMVNSLNKSEQSYAYMIGPGGTYIVHYIKERILTQTIFGAGDRMTNNQEVRRLGEEMIAGHSGMQVIDNDGVLSYVFYSPVPDTNWSLALVLPEQEIFGGLKRIRWTVGLIAAVGLLLLFFFVRRVVHSMTRPLEKFAASARAIARGDFEARLPRITSHDEMRQLANAFSYMQKELGNYIADLKDTTSAKEKIESELRIARDIQMGMIPKIFPPFPHCTEFDLYAVLNPAREVGGDLYDFFMEDDNLCFVIGDVSGKGVPASLFMAVTRSLFRSVATGNLSPAQIVARLNDSISENNEANMFVTLFVAVLNIHSGEMRFCNAGHNPPLLLSPDGTCRFIEARPNIPVGVAEGFAYTEQSITLDRGTTLVCYTDGVTEAENTACDLYGDDRLQSTVSQSRGLSPRALVERMVDDIADHVAENIPSDDITLLVIAYEGPPAPGEEPARITIANNIEELPDAIGFFESFCERQEIPPALQMSLTLALEEALANVIQYAYGQTEGKIELILRHHGGKLTVRIVDSGAAFDPTARPDPDLTLGVEDRPIGGLGITLVRKIMDQVDYRRENNDNILLLTKTIEN